MVTKKTSVRRALILSFGQRITSLVITLPTIIIVSHLLTPAEVGVYSVAVAFVNLVQMLRDFGVSEYLIQERHLNDALARTAFTITLSIAWILAALLFISSPWFGEFYHNPGLKVVLRILSINFVLLPFGSTTNMLLRRDMQFGILYKIGTGQQIIQSSTTILLSFLGFGYIGLAWGSVAGMTALVLGCLTWGRKYRVRGIGLLHYRRVLRFGITRTLGDIVIRLGQSAPDFVIGRVLGFADAGLYSRGYGLINTFRENVIGAISAVAFPTFAQYHRDTNNAHKIFLKSVTYLTGISWPFFIFSALMALPIIHFMFGTKWLEAVPILQLLSITALIGTLVYQCNDYFTAIGHVGFATRAETMVQVSRIILLAVTIFISLNAVAASQIFVYALAGVIYYRLLLKHTRLTIKDIVVALRSSAIVAICSAIVPCISYFIFILFSQHIGISILISSAGALIGWFIGIYITRHPLFDEVVNITTKIRYSFK